MYGTRSRHRLIYTSRLCVFACVSFVSIWVCVCVNGNESTELNIEGKRDYVVRQLDMGVRVCCCVVW